VSPAGEGAVWWLVLGAGGCSVLLLGTSLTRLICDADTLVPRVVRELPAHTQQLAADTVAALRQAALWLAVSLLLLATPHTQETR
jgi:hypothetical protein